MLFVHTDAHTRIFFHFSSKNVISTKDVWCLPDIRVSVSLHTCIPEFLVPVHRQDNQQISHDISHGGEDQQAGEGGRYPGRRALGGEAGVSPG